MISTEARDTLSMMAHNRTQQQYTDLIWAERVMGKPAKRARSKSWPVSCYDKSLGGYVLAQEGASNVTKLPVRKRKP